LAARRKPATDAPPTLEALLTSPQGFGLVTASPLQRAVCRVAEGRPLGELANEPSVRTAIGDVEALPLGTRPTELYLVSGSRVGKTLFSAALALHAVLTVDVSALGPGDEPRIPILSLDKDKAAACYTHLVNTMRARPALAPLIVKEGRNELDSLAVWIRHPSGRPIQVCVAAGKAAGNAVVSYFLAGAIFDEFCKMAGADQAVVNFSDSRRNALGRLLPGAQLVAIGSPWAPFGPAYDAVTNYWKKPSRALVVIKARGREMNPSWWTPERIAGLPAEVLRTEEEAEFADAESSLYSSVEVDRATRKAPAALRPVAGEEYVATTDAATRGNAWTLTVGTRTRPDRVVVVLARQWVGSKVAPLSPRAVLREIAAVLAPYGVDVLHGDQWAADALRDLAEEAGLTLVESTSTAAEKEDRYAALGARLAEQEIELPPDAQLRTDLLAVKKRVTQTGVSIHLPKTGDGRHCDYAPALTLLVERVNALALPPENEREEESIVEARRMRDERFRTVRREKAREWWEDGHSDATEEIFQ
jgi:hypothetical protein